MDLESKVREVFTMMEKAPASAFFWCKVVTTAFTFTNLLLNHAYPFAHENVGNAKFDNFS